MSLLAACGTASALLVAMVDVVQCKGEVGAGAPLLALAALGLTLYPAVGLVTGLALGLAGGGLAAVWPREGLLAWLRNDRDRDRAAAAALLSAAACVGVEVLVVFAFAGRVAAGMANPRLAALSTALVAGAGLLLGVLLFLAFFELLRHRALRWVPPIGAVTVTVGLALLVGVVSVGLYVLGSLDWRVLRFTPWVTLLALVVLAVGLARWLGPRWGRLSRPIALVTAVTLTAGLSAAALPAGRSAAGVAAAGEGGLLMPLLIRVARGVGDHDGDGFARSGWFGGGDCDDGNPAVNPGARDIPGNGIDENCHGGDAPRHVRAAPRQPTRAARTASFEGNVLLVCVDTLRADKLGVMGNKDGLTPTIDALAKSGVLFARTFSQGPNTPQSFPAIFTSAYPSRIPFYKTFTGYPRLKPEAVTLFEVLKQHGVHTAAVTSHFYFKPMRGITQGVEDWDNRDATNIKDSNKDISAPRIVPRAIAKLMALARSKQRFALFVHLSEPHSTYMKHPGFPITKRGVAGLQQKYDYEIKFADLWLGKLLEGLKKAGLQQNTAVVLFADHGEAFHEHRFYFHGQALYNEVLHVPLILRLPGRLATHRVVKQRTALIDLAPTVLDLMGIPAPQSFQGISLLPLARGEELPELDRRRIGAVLMPYPAWPKGQQAMFSGHYKVLRRTTENRLEIYDLRADPGEQNNLALKQPQLARRLQQELLSFAEQEM